MAYADPDTVAVINPGDPIPAAWTRIVRDDLEFLIDPPSCSVFNSSAQSVAHNTTTTMACDSQNFDNDGMHDPVTNNSRITAQTAGRYVFLVNISWDADSTGIRRIGFVVNGTTTLSGQLTFDATSSLSAGMGSVRAITLAVGDYVEITTQQTSGGALDTFMREFTATLLTR